MIAISEIINGSSAPVSILIKEILNNNFLAAILLIGKYNFVKLDIEIVSWVQGAWAFDFGKAVHVEEALVLSVMGIADLVLVSISIQDHEKLVIVANQVVIAVVEV